VETLRKNSGIAALLVSIVAVVTVTVASAGASSSNPLTKAFSFQNTTNNKSKTLFTIDGLTINARCDPKNAPVIFAFSSTNADIFGHVVDGSGRTHVIANDSFTKKNKGISLAPNITGDRDASGEIVYEATNRAVVTINYGFDNSPTLANKHVCTVFGTYTAT
jgi:hypothetical protein